ncbi:hypothetical protein CTAYLR_002406 [Chrysophaeum taylorii]|uniref:Phytanoyl-CoA dioxygenase n=1 Tax=Chrysophaeum taylorii TaxID=2483200 RepID=A0AAD7XN54_9STRA|nr:hypothetical protein CTAYLR_002406 [Chrysophaeum taylorii]
MVVLVVVQLVAFCVVAHGLSSSSSSSSQNNRLFLDQQEAMARQAAHEEAVFGGTERELVVPKAVRVAASKVKRGSGFAGGRQSPAEKEAAARAKVLAREGVLKMPGLGRDTAAKLRAAVLSEIDEAREAVKLRPETSMSRFHAREEQKLRSFVLLPLRRDEGLDDPIVSATAELLGEGTPLGDLYEKLCGPEAVLYDFYGLRTEPGSFRQPIHSDTPFQRVPPLYASFVALQDVDLDMGPTTFLPGTHTETDARLDFDVGMLDGRRDAMLAKAKPKFALLEAGDLVIFDMRVLHFGAANHPDKGATRIFLNLTFRNPRANADNLGHIPCIRPGFVNRFTLRDIRCQLKSDAPFDRAGTGLPPLSPAARIERQARVA